MKQNDYVVIDANVIKGLFQETIHGTHDLTDSPGAFFSELRTKDCTIIMDDGDHIQQEWKDVVEYEWFVAWYSDLVTQTAVNAISCAPHGHLLKALRNDCGFPRTENAWLVKAAATQSGMTGSCVISTEDIDFYEPKYKLAAGARAKAIATGRGSVVKVLNRVAVHVLPLHRSM